VVERLTKEALDEDSSPSARINALKALGTVAGVDAFVHRTETTVIKDSAKIRDDLMNQLKQAMQANTIDLDDDAAQLMAEISPAPKRKPDTATPPEGDPTSEQKESHQILHNNPDKRTPSENISQQNHTLPEQVSTLTVDLPEEEGGGGVKKHPDWEELSTGNTPVSGFKTKG